MRETVSRLDVDEQLYAAGTAVQSSESTLAATGQQYAVTSGDSLSGGTLGGLSGSPFVISDSGESRAEARIVQSGLKYLLITITVVTVPVRLDIVG